MRIKVLSVWSMVHFKFISHLKETVFAVFMEILPSSLFNQVALFTIFSSCHVTVAWLWVIKFKSNYLFIN